MKIIKFETVRKYGDFNTKTMECYDYFELIQYLRRNGYVKKDLGYSDWELEEMSQKKLKKLIVDNFNKKHFFDITEFETERGK